MDVGVHGVQTTLSAWALAWWRDGGPGWVMGSLGVISLRQGKAGLGCPSALLRQHRIQAEVQDMDLQVWHQPAVQRHYPRRGGIEPCIRQSGTKCVSWLNPSQKINTPHAVTCTLFLVGWGERIRRVEVREFVGWHKDNLKGKAKAIHASKAKNGIHSPFPIGRQREFKWQVV